MPHGLRRGCGGCSWRLFVAKVRALRWSRPWPMQRYRCEVDHAKLAFLPYRPASEANNLPPVAPERWQRAADTTRPRVCQNANFDAPTFWVTPKRTCLSVICSSVVGQLRWKEHIKKHQKFLIFLTDKLDFIFLCKIRNNDRTIEYII